MTTDDMLGYARAALTRIAAEIGGSQSARVPDGRALDTQTADIAHRVRAHNGAPNVHRTTLTGSP